MSSRRRLGSVVLRILAVFTLVLVAYYAFAVTELYETRVFDPYVALNARISGVVLGWLGYADVAVRGAEVRAGGFQLEVGRGCDGIEPTMLFVAAVLAFPAPLRRKLAAIGVGAPLLAALNVVRVISLQLVGIHAPQLFQTMHVEVWQALYIVVAIGVFGAWLLWVSRPGAPVPALPEAS